MFVIEYTLSTLARWHPGGSRPAGSPPLRDAGSEAAEVRRRLEPFDPSLSPIGQLLRVHFPGATKGELISVAQMTVLVANQRFPSDQPVLASSTESRAGRWTSS
jgi:hypothetical protein